MSSIIINIGETGNGKNYRCEMLLDRDKEKGNKNELGEDYKYYCVDPKKEFVHRKEILQLNPHKNICADLEQIEYGKVFVDEAQLYFKLAGSQEALLHTTSVCRHNRTTVVFNFTAIQLVPIYVQLFINQIWLGHTNDSFDACKGFGKWENAMRGSMFALTKNIDVPFAAIYLDKFSLEEYANIHLMQKKGLLV